MVPFDLVLELESKQLIISVEQLDQLADAEGFMRYQVTADTRRSVICVNVEDGVPPLFTPQDVEAYFEAVYYPEQAVAYSTEDVFTHTELRQIAAAVRLHNRSQRLSFDQMHFDF
jgi:hypothetical protein